MNDYPVWWNTTVTVYNKYENPTTNLISWYRTVIPMCFWKPISEKLVVNAAVVNANSIICRVPKNVTYREPYEWEQTPNDIKNQYFTLNLGDIIIKGEVEDTINEYQSGHRSSDLLAKYKRLQGGLEIKTVRNSTGPGRCDEHYYVLGE